MLSKRKLMLGQGLVHEPMQPLENLALQLRGQLQGIIVHNLLN